MATVVEFLSASDQRTLESGKEGSEGFLKIGQQMACLPTKLNFLANGCVLGQNARKETPFKIQFYCQDNIILLSAPFLNLINGIGLFFLPHFHPLCLLAGNLQPNFQIALTYSILKLKSILIPPDKMT